jgi:hypothetical protein
MVVANARGARRDWVAEAVETLATAGSPEEYLRNIARAGHTLVQERDGADGLDDPASLPGLALEMALHEETERRAMEGELAMLETMWREAEEIAGIADRLPDVDAPDPPRIPSAE